MGPHHVLNEGFKLLKIGGNGAVFVGTSQMNKNVKMVYKSNKGWCARFCTSALTWQEVADGIGLPPELRLKAVDSPPNEPEWALCGVGPVPAASEVCDVLSDLPVTTMMAPEVVPLPESVGKPFFTKHRSFVQMQRLDEGEYLMPYVGLPLSRMDPITDVAAQRDLMTTLVAGVHHALSVGVPLPDIGPNNFVVEKCSITGFLRGMIIDIDTVVQSLNRSARNSSTLRASNPIDSLVLATVTSTALTLAVIAGTPYQEIVDQFCWEVKTVAPLRAVKEVCPECCAPLRKAITGVVTVGLALQALQGVLDNLSPQ